MRTLFLILLVVLVGVSCTNHSNVSVNHPSCISVPDAMNSDVHYLSEFIDSARIVRLETNDSCLLREIELAEVHNGKIFVSWSRADHIYCFDANGKFLNTIASRGGGPKECVEISGFTVNKDNGYIYVTSRADQKIKIYKDNGDFVKALSVDYAADVISCHQDKIYLFVEGNSMYPCEMQVYDSNGKYLGGHYPIDKRYSSETIVRKTNSDLYVLPLGKNRDTIYTVKDNGLEMACFTNWGDYTMNESTKDKMFVPDYKGGLDSKKKAELQLSLECVFGIEDFLMFDKYVYLSYICRLQPRHCFWDKENNVAVNTIDFCDDVAFAAGLSDIVGQTDTEMIAAYNGSRALTKRKFVARDKWQEKYGKNIPADKLEDGLQRLETLFKDVQEDDNPALVFYKIKQ